MDDELLRLSTQLGHALIQRKLTLALAESCTGGMASQFVTAIAGSSAWFEASFVTYSNQAKQRMLDVPADTLSTYGAVSEQTASAMAQGALKNSQAGISASITGIAGPDGGTAEKPVGLVYFSWASHQYGSKTSTKQFEGNRHEIRQQAVATALRGLIEMLATTH